MHKKIEKFISVQKNNHSAFFLLFNFFSFELNNLFVNLRGNQKEKRTECKSVSVFVAFQFVEKHKGNGECFNKENGKGEGPETENKKKTKQKRKKQMPKVNLNV